MSAKICTTDETCWEYYSLTTDAEKAKSCCMYWEIVKFGDDATSTAELASYAALGYPSKKGQSEKVCFNNYPNKLVDQVDHVST